MICQTLLKLTHINMYDIWTCHLKQSCQIFSTDLKPHDTLSNLRLTDSKHNFRAVEGGGKVRGMKEILAAIDEGGERGLDLSDSVFVFGCAAIGREIQNT